MSIHLGDRHVDMRSVVQLHADHAAGRADASYALWALWVLERWLQRAAQPALR